MCRSGVCGTLGPAARPVKASGALFGLTGAQSGWTRGIGHSHYLMMILGLSATLGVFLLIASRNPAAHRSLIWFTVWSSVVHAVIMAVQFTPRGRAMA
jgi:hypothetical protein